MRSGFGFDKLPHYSREFTARSGSAAVQTLILSFLGLFIISFFTDTGGFNPLQKALKNTRDTPFSDQARLNLAQAYFDLRQLNLAQKETDIAKFLNFDRSPPGFEQLENDLVKLPLQEAEADNFWQSVVMKYPDYKEGWIMLMYLAKNQNNPDKLNRFRQKLENLNPNYLKNLPPGF